MGGRGLSRPRSPPCPATQLGCLCRPGGSVWLLSSLPSWPRRGTITSRRQTTTMEPSSHRTPTFSRGSKSPADVGTLRPREGSQPTCESISVTFRSWPQPSALIKVRRKVTLSACGLGGPQGACVPLRWNRSARPRGGRPRVEVRARAVCLGPRPERSEDGGRRRDGCCVETLVPGWIRLLVEGGDLRLWKSELESGPWLLCCCCYRPTEVLRNRATLEGNPICLGHPGV